MTPFPVLLSLPPFSPQHLLQTPHRLICLLSLLSYLTPFLYADQRSDEGGVGRAVRRGLYLSDLLSERRRNLRSILLIVPQGSIWRRESGCACVCLWADSATWLCSHFTDDMRSRMSVNLCVLAVESVFHLTIKKNKHYKPKANF